MKFQPAFGIGTNRIALKPSWTKGRRYREISITTKAQRKVLQTIELLAKNGSLIPPDKSYREQLKTYEHQTLKAGIRNPHGLRHNWAQWRYEQLAKMPCPFKGGKSWKEMSEEERHRDRMARKQLAQELGHGRMHICNIYIGRALSCR